MGSRRLMRVAEVIRLEASRLISRERSLEGDLVTITSVEVATDLKHAFVYVTSLNTEISQPELLRKLEAVRAGWQHKIGSKMHTKYTPRLTFRWDDAQQRGDRVLQILEGLETGERDAA